MMISIKRFLEPARDGPVPDHSLVEALMQMARLLLDAMASRVVPGSDADLKSLRRTLGELAHRMEGTQSSMTLLGIASDAAEALDTYRQRTRGQIATARKMTPDDPRHPADAKHPAGKNGVLDLLSEATDELGVESLPASYVAAFKLQRAEHIANRFGETVKHQMLNLIATELKTVLGPHDRLLRWRGTSFVMFINSTAAIPEIRSRLAKAVAATSQQYIEVGRNSALLSVGMDWIVSPQAGRPLDAVFTEVDAFLANAALAVRKGN